MTFCNLSQTVLKDLRKAENLVKANFGFANDTVCSLVTYIRIHTGKYSAYW